MTCDREAIERDLDVACAELGDDELRVVAYLAARLLAGQRAYGQLDLAHDPRDWRRERADEIADLLVYTAFAENDRDAAGVVMASYFPMAEPPYRTMSLPATPPRAWRPIVERGLAAFNGLVFAAIVLFGVAPPLSAVVPCLALFGFLLRGRRGLRVRDVAQRTSLAPGGVACPDRYGRRARLRSPLAPPGAAFASRPNCRGDCVSGGGPTDRVRDRPLAPELTAPG